ncbi:MULTISPECIES: ArnT family glycosyltransferase [Sphingomonas]|uniref:ArnT family glycosyltransferase n=1 Tax=Sphingomonas TaxID=13687 RepID=UPI000B101BF7|nr:hypothetical protein [Sphingomonas sp. CCH10-B3]
MIAPRHISAALLLVLVLAALALRCWDFGNPVIHVDEQYYLLVGDRMLHGALPYIDVWDRKPIGLFLIFAAIRLLPGDGILAYQLVATGFAAATAWCVWRAARMIGAAPLGAFAAGCAYLVWVSLLGGRGGQSPVFYNLLMAAAMLLVLRLPHLADRRAVAGIIASGMAACLLAGLAIQIKYTPVFEGAFFGLAHLWYLRRAGAPPGLIAAAALLWMACGAAPSLLAIGFYQGLGQRAFDAFWFANVTSIFLRPGYPIDQLLMRLLGIFAQLGVLIVAGALGWRARATGPHARETWLATLWAAAALAGFAAIGTFFDHYALPLVAPIALLAAPTLARGWRVAAGALGIGLAILIVRGAIRPNDAPGARAVARLVALNSRGACPYVFIGDTITYRLANACLPTAYAFPNLLAYTTEQGATGIDEAAEVRRILRARPPVILASTRRLAIWNSASVAELRPVLARDYSVVFSTPRENYRTLVYLRRDLPLRR